MTNPTPTSAARPMQGLNCKNPGGCHFFTKRKPCLASCSFTHHFGPASEVEAVQAQPAIVVGKIVELDYVRDMVVVKVAPGIAESMPICAQVTISAAQPASAPMGEPSEYKRGMTLRECMEAEERPVACQHCEGWKRLAEIALEGAAMDKRIKEIREQYGLDASPAQARMPLSEEQILRVFFDVYGEDNTTRAVPWTFARAIEAAHDISGDSSRAADGVTEKRGG